MLEPGVAKKTRHSITTCVVVMLQENGSVAVSDSKDATLPPHIYTRDEWIDFVKGVKDGEFDHPLSEAPQLTNA